MDTAASWVSLVPQAALDGIKADISTMGQSIIAIAVIIFGVGLLIKLFFS